MNTDGEAASPRSFGVSEGGGQFFGGDTEVRILVAGWKPTIRVTEPGGTLNHRFRRWDRWGELEVGGGQGSVFASLRRDTCPLSDFAPTWLAGRA